MQEFTSTRSRSGLFGKIFDIYGYQSEISKITTYRPTPVPGHIELFQEVHSDYT